MDSLTLELKIVSASDLKKSNPFSSNIQPYVVVSISGAGAALPAQKTPVDAEGGRNPTWNHPLALSVPGDLATSNLTLKFEIRSRRALAADKLIGEVCVPLRNLLHTASPSPSAGGGKTPAPATFVSYQVKKPSGRPKGVLTFSYRLAGRVSGVVATGEPVVAYPAKPPVTGTVYPPAAPANLYPPHPPPPPSAPPAGGTYYPPPLQLATGYPSVDGYKYDVYPPPSTAAQTSYGYPTHTAAQTSYGYPTQGGYGYGYPVQTGYGHPGQTGYGCGNGYGYGYRGQVVQPSRKNGSGLGAGAGLLGGALAGMVIGDLVSDAVFDF